MAENKFKIGDVVTLKSGGTPMTIEKINEESNKVDCIWFVDTQLKRESLDVSIIEKKKSEIIKTTITEKF